MEVVTYDPIAVKQDSEICFDFITGGVKHSVRLGLPPRVNPITTYREVSEGLQLSMKYKHHLFVQASTKKKRTARSPMYVVPGGEVLDRDVGYINDRTVVVSKGCDAYRNLIENKPQQFLCDVGRTTNSLLDGIRDRLPAGVTISTAEGSKGFAIESVKGVLHLNKFTAFSSMLCMRNTSQGIEGSYPAMTMQLSPSIKCPLAAVHAAFSLRQVHEETPLCRILRNNESIEVNLQAGLYDCAEIAKAIEIATSKKIKCTPTHGGVNLSSLDEFSIIGLAQKNFSQSGLVVVDGFEKHGVNNALMPIVDSHGTPVSQLGFSIFRNEDRLFYQHGHTLLSRVPHRSQRPSTSVFDVWRLMNDRSTCFSGEKVPKSKVCTLCSPHHLEILYMRAGAKELKSTSRPAGTSTEIFLY